MDARVSDILQAALALCDAPPNQTAIDEAIFAFVQQHGGAGEVAKILKALGFRTVECMRWQQIAASRQQTGARDGTAQ